MIKSFKEWLFSENKEILHSWLSPQGKFIPLMGKSHGDYAQFLGSNIDQMWQKGWARIIYFADKIYAHNEKMPINSNQKKALIDAAIENHMNYVVYDSGDDEKIIWSEFDKI